MDKISNRLKLVAWALGILLISYLGLVALASLNQGYSWQEMDWQQRGKTSLGDFFAASDIGKREILQGNKRCVEYYAYKDGMPVKIVCPEVREDGK